MSSGPSQKREAHLQGDVKQLLAFAEAAENEKIPDGLTLPAEIARRADRLKAIATAKTTIDARAQERFEREQADDPAKRDQRETPSKERGKPPRGRAPRPPVAGAQDKDPIHRTDDASRLMNVAGGGVEPGDNGQRAGDMNSRLMVAPDTVQAGHDKQHVKPMRTQLETLPDERGTPVHLIADTGDFSEANVTACGDQKITPLIAVQRDAHPPDPLARVAEPPPLKKGATEGERRRHALLTMAGRALYAQRNGTVEPVLGRVTSVMSVRQCSLRGLDPVKGEWNLVARAWNVKQRMFVLAGSLRAATA